MSIKIKHEQYDAGETWHFGSPSFWHKLHPHIPNTYVSGYLLEAPREYVCHGLVLGSDWTPCQLSSTCIILVCLGPPSTRCLPLHFMFNTCTPPLPIGQLNTSTQVNNMAMLHLIYNSFYISTTYAHYYSFSSSYFFYTSEQAGWPRSLLLGTPTFIVFGRQQVFTLAGF